MYKLSDEKIEQFLVESSMMQSFLIDDGPPTFYKSFGEYKKNAKSWMNDLYKELGWKVIDYMIRKNAQDPGYDYELRYRALGAVSYLDSGTKSGNVDAIEKYKEIISQYSKNEVSYEVGHYLERLFPSIFMK